MAGLDFTIAFQNTRGSAVTINSATLELDGGMGFDDTEITELQGGTVPSGNFVVHQESEGPIAICGSDPPPLTARISISGSNGCSASATYNWNIGKQCWPRDGDCFIFDNFCCSGKCTNQRCEAPADTMVPFCFSGDSTVVREHDGIVSMKDLQIGDRVLNANGDFDRVFSFGHYGPHVKAEFLQLHLEGKHVLEATADHMVFRDDGVAVPAGLIRVGDKLQLAASHGEASVLVEKIQTVTKTGVYAPITESGTIAVNNVAASSFVSMQKDSYVLMMGAFQTPLSYQWIGQITLAPHRLMCALNFDYCTSETYTEDGVSTWVVGLLQFSQWLVQQNIVIMLLAIIPALLVFGVATAAEAVVTHGWLACVAVGSVCWLLRDHKKRV